MMTEESDDSCENFYREGCWASTVMSPADVQHG